MSSQQQQPSVPDLLRKPNDNHTLWLLRRVWDRVNQQNEHFMGCIVGREGSGKSYTALKIANNVDKSFNADRVIFDVADLLEVLKDGDHEPGNFYVLDEAGVSLGRRTWQDRAQILANQALQLVRSHNLGLIFTLPRLSELDSQAEGRLQAVLEVVEKKPDEYVKVKWKFIDPDRIDAGGNILKKYPRRMEDGYKKRITRNAFAPPDDDELVADYEARKGEFQEKVYEETISQLNGEDEEDEEQELSARDVADKVQEDGIGPYVCIHGGNGNRYIDKDLLREDYDLTHRGARTVKSLLEKEYDTDDLQQYA